MCQDSLKLYLFNFKKKNLTKLGFRVRFELRLTNLKIKSPVSDIFFFLPCPQGPTSPWSSRADASSWVQELWTGRERCM